MANRDGSGMEKGEEAESLVAVDWQSVEWFWCLHVLGGSQGMIAWKPPFASHPTAPNPAGRLSRRIGKNNTRLGVSLQPRYPVSREVSEILF